MNNLENLNILITGASGGIGTSLSKAFASTKANLFLVGSSEEKISKLRNELPTRENINYFSVDLSERENVNQFCDSIIEKYGGISIIVNNAGVTEDNLFMRMSDNAWDKVFAINLDASMIICRKFIRGMIKNKWGRIVNISSDAAKIGNPGQSNYVASKSAIEGLTRTIANEVASRGITVNCVAPGFIKTEILDSVDKKRLSMMEEKIPLGRIGNANEIASVVYFLSSEESNRERLERVRH